jgi:5-methylcytosine-specific restriction endonuclease McrA
MGHFKMASLFKSFQTVPLDVTPSKNKIKRQRKQKQKQKQQQQQVIKAEPPPLLPASKKKRKKAIPAALREQVWIVKMGKVFEGKCPVTWCQNKITVFDFQSGHNIPESKGGKTDLDNLIPICSRCNLSMGNEYSIDEWSQMSELPVKTVPEVKPQKSWWCWKN